MVHSREAMRKDLTGDSAVAEALEDESTSSIIPERRLVSPKSMSWSSRLGRATTCCWRFRDAAPTSTARNFPIFGNITCTLAFVLMNGLTDGLHPEPHVAW